ncbi:hypothetical protein HCN83_17265 [Bacillus luteus]|uniref:Uncharacterized protein n=1 Tax=Alkalicoccus luteus TaxID=1237094 RepID=A0A969TV26_9BACI|nr:hypothetical protein [Alkalicoccus luteus]
MDQVLPDEGEMNSFETHLSPVLSYAFIFSVFLLPLALFMWLIWPHVTSLTGLGLALIAIILLMAGGYITSIKGIDLFTRRKREKNKAKLLDYINQAAETSNSQSIATEMSEPLKRAIGNDLEAIKVLYMHYRSDQEQLWRFSLTDVRQFEKKTDRAWELFTKESYQKEDRAFIHRLAMYYRLTEESGEAKLIKFGETGSMK